MPGTPLFPRYLNQGSKGGAVNMLGLLLIAAGFQDIDHPIVLDGDYAMNGAIARAVRNLQRELDFTGDAVDGNFGPETRDAVLRKGDIDINALTLEMFTEPTVAVGPETSS